VKNWFRLNRSIFDNELWLIEPFDKCRAWIDMIGNANYEDGSIFIRGNEVKVKRGQLAWGERFMANRWKWSRNKVRGYMQYLSKRQQIVPQNNNVISLYTIVNYEKYQSERIKKVPQMIPQTVPQKVPLLNKDKKEKNNIYNEIILYFNETTGRKARKVDERAVDYWLEFYSLEEIKSAILKISGDEFWKDKMDLTILFRRKNPQGEAVDYISQLLNRTQKLSMKRFDTL